MPPGVALGRVAGRARGPPAVAPARTPETVQADWTVGYRPDFTRHVDRGLGVAAHPEPITLPRR